MPSTEASSPPEPHGVGPADTSARLDELERQLEELRTANAALLDLLAHRSAENDTRRRRRMTVETVDENTVEVRVEIRAP